MPDCQRMVNNMEWISVEDRLPETTGQYLVYTECRDMFNAEFDRDCGECGEFGSWHGHYHPDTLGFLDSDWDTYHGITHWAILPQPPEDGE